jgi:hypothetical protein
MKSLETGPSSGNDKLFAEKNDQLIEAARKIRKSTQENYSFSQWQI